MKRWLKLQIASSPNTISFQRAEGRGSTFHRSESGHLESNTQGYWHRCLNVNFCQSLAIPVIAPATHLKQVFLIWTAGNYPIHLKGTLPFNIKHSVRLHQPDSALVTAAAEWWMCLLRVHSLVSVWVVGSSGKQMIRKGSSYLGPAFSLLIQSLSCQLSHLAANSVQVYLKNELLKNYLMGHFHVLLQS